MNEPEKTGTVEILPCTAVAVPQSVAVSQSDAHAIMRLIESAMTKPDFDVAKLQALLDVKERWERDEARKAFVVALIAFKANPPEIVKDKQVRFTTSKGVTEYKHALSGAASEQIGAALAAQGISHRWDVEQLEGKIRVTCILTHALGHSERVTLAASADDSGGKNSIQAIGSTVSYLQRYSLLAATGVVPKDADDDARGGAGEHVMAESVKADFLAAVEALADGPSWEALWGQITAATTDVGDVAAHEELRSAMARKRKTLTAATGAGAK